MSWRYSATNNPELVANLIRNHTLHTERVIEAFKKTDRGLYCLSRANAYEDSPQYIGHNATISAPIMHAYAVENLLPFLHPGSKVLDIGSGSGYLCTVIHHLVGSEGKVIGVEHIPELVEWSVQNLRKDALGGAVDDGSIRMIVGDGRKGYPQEGPYDAIHVGAAAPILPDALVEQLASPGRMFIPVGTYSQAIIQVDKDAEGRIHQKQILPVIYVPLTDKEKQDSGSF